LKEQVSGFTRQGSGFGLLDLACPVSTAGWGADGWRP